LHDPKLEKLEGDAGSATPDFIGEGYLLWCSLNRWNVVGGITPLNVEIGGQALPTLSR
jgi:hypothetical protein